MAGATTTKSGRGTRGGGSGIRDCGDSGKGKAAVRPVVTSVIKPMDIEVGLIERCPFQPRQQFPAEEIKALAESIATHGQIHPIAVRLFLQSPNTNPQYELVDGERRFRAVRSLGWKTIRAEVGGYTDAQVRAVVLATALQRKELNAIEEARAFQAAIDAGDAAGPTELAAQLGLSQGHISNRLRLLELPERIQKRVISREIPATHARSIARYKDAPTIVAAIEKQIDEDKQHGNPIGSTEDFDEIVDDVAYGVTQPMADAIFSSKLNRTIPVFKPTEEQREQLGVIEVPWGYGKSKKPVLRAVNVELWNKLQSQHEAILVERAKKKEGTGKVSGTRAKADAKKPLTPAEKKRLAAEDRQREKERAEKLARGVWLTAIDWRRQLIAEACRTDQVSPEDIARLLLFLGASAAGIRSGASCGLHEIGCREEALGDVLKMKTTRGKPQLWTALENVEDRDVLSRALEYLAKLVWNPDEGGEASIDAEDVLAIADKLAIDLAAAWKKEALGKPWTEQWLELRTKDQLNELAKSWKIEARSGKADMVAALLVAARRQKPPAELLKPKRPK